MKKENLAAMILGITGGIPFALGMVMTLVSTWNLLIPGIITGAIGLVILLAILPVYRKMTKKAVIRLDGKIIISLVIGIVGTLGLGVGLSTTLLNTETMKMLLGIVIGLVGIILCIINYPIYKTLTNKKNEEIK